MYIHAEAIYNYYYSQAQNHRGAQNVCVCVFFCSVDSRGGSEGHTRGLYDQLSRGSRRPDPHETHVSRINPKVAGRIGSGRRRVWNPAGRVEPGQGNFKSHGSGRIKWLSHSRILGRDKSTHLKRFAGRFGSDPSRSDP